MRSWNTTVFGMLAALLVLWPSIQSVLDDDPATNPDYEAVALALGLAGVGVFAQDNGKSSVGTGGHLGVLRPSIMPRTQDRMRSPAGRGPKGTPAPPPKRYAYPDGSLLVGGGYQPRPSDNSIGRPPSGDAGRSAIQPR